MRASYAYLAGGGIAWVARINFGPVISDRILDCLNARNLCAICGVEILKHPNRATIGAWARIGEIGSPQIVRHTVWGYSAARHKNEDVGRAFLVRVRDLRDCFRVRFWRGSKKNPRCGFLARETICRARVPAARSTWRRREEAAAARAGRSGARGLERCRHRGPSMAAKKRAARRFFRV